MTTPADRSRGTGWRDNRGVALILTIMAVTIIVALSVQFNRTMRDHLASAAGVDHGLRALYAAKSGISYGMALLAEDSPKVDTLFDAWADGEKVDKISAESRGLFEGGYFELKVEDLSGKIQLNSLVDIDPLGKVFERLLGMEDFGLEEDTIRELICAIEDWVDQDEDSGSTRCPGYDTEDYYMSLDPPYRCKNAPLDSVGELSLVRDMPKELLYGAEDRPGIAAYVTVYGDGKININTADARVLQCLHEEITGSMAQEMDAYRREMDESVLESTTWYHNGGAGVPEDIKLPKEIVSTQSSHFQLTATGHFGDFSKRIVAVVNRKLGDDDRVSFHVVSWRIN